LTLQIGAHRFTHVSARGTVVFLFE